MLKIDKKLKEMSEKTLANFCQSMTKDSVGRSELFLFNNRNLKSLLINVNIVYIIKQVEYKFIDISTNFEPLIYYRRLNYQK